MTDQNTNWISAKEVAVASPTEASSWNDDPKNIALLCWIFAPFPFLVATSVLKMNNDEFVKFHRRQSFVFGVLNLLLLIPLLFIFVPTIGWIIMAVVWLFLVIMLFGRFYYAYRAYQGESPVVPLVGFFSRWIKQVEK